MKSSEQISDKFMIIYNELYTHEKNDSAFYTTDAPNWVATAYFEDKALEVWTAGEMKILLPNDGGYIRYFDELEEIGITNDKELQEFSDKYLDSWIHNSWFEIRTPKGEWLDEGFLAYVYHDVQEAVSACLAIMQNPEEYEVTDIDMSHDDDPWNDKWKQ